MDKNLLVFLPFLLPIATALLCLAFNGYRVQRAFCSFGMILQVLLGAYLAYAAFNGAIFVSSAGGWPVPYGIVLVIDLLSAGMLLPLAIVFFAIIAFDQPVERQHPLQLPLLLFLQAGANLSVTTGDFFNLFVAFEVMLAASYGLMSLTDPAEDKKPAYLYLVTGAISSSLFLIIVALIYNGVGTLNMADLSILLDTRGEDSLALAIGILGLIVFGTKAGIFPFYFWLPESYPTLSGPIAGLFSSVLTKVGIYVLIRLFLTILPNDMPLMRTILLLTAQATMLFGVLGAIAQITMQRIFSYHILSQIGYMIMGIALFTQEALAATLLFIWHNMFVKSSLFVIGSATKSSTGSDDLREIGGLWGSLPFIGVLLLVQSLSLAGIPPLSGFWGKYLLFLQGLDSNAHVTVAVAMITSFLTLFSMMKIWTKGYWGSKKAPSPLKAPRYVASAVILTGISLVVGLAIEPFAAYAAETGNHLYHKDLYRNSIIERSRK
ncbi:MAG: hypothetical protein H7A37_10510 [Chlamydiales bacterium]|nr:hypothetical protein [Chlamydiia bacterium]MCP5508709.1 hypothetical protein [Chlamydiales bacterium]